VSLISSRIVISFECKPIVKRGLTRHLILFSEKGVIETLNEPSASANPDINHGLNLGKGLNVEKFCLFNCLEGILI
jgi:hypothetical protein